MWVILMRPKQRQPGPPPYGDLFLAKDGTTTESRDRAAKFLTAESALALAREKGIKVDGVTRYPYQVDFNEVELQGD